MNIETKEQFDNKEQALSENLGVLVNIWELDEKSGKFKEMQNYADMVSGLVQRYYDYDKQIVNNPLEFLTKLRKYKEKAVLRYGEGAENDELFNKIFDKLDMPDFEIK